MQSVRSMIELHNGRARRGGFTLVELMVVVVVIGILSAMAAPSFNKAFEQSGANITYANLRAIWAAERVYWLEHHKFVSPNTDPVAWNTLFGPAKLLAPAILDSIVETDSASDKYYVDRYHYSLTVSSDTSFSATATRQEGSGFSGWSGYFTINSDGAISGSISGAGTTITPGTLQ